MRAFLLCIFCLCFAHCGEFEVLDHNKKVRKSADSLYRIQRPVFQKLADSMCNAQFDMYKETAIDTLRIDRLEEIKKLVDEQ